MGGRLGLGIRTWIVSLTERYEVTVEARTRKDALLQVREFGGSGPVWSRVTAVLAGQRKKGVYDGFR